MGSEMCIRDSAETAGGPEVWVAGADWLTDRPAALVPATSDHHRRAGWTAAVQQADCRAGNPYGWDVDAQMDAVRATGRRGVLARTDAPGFEGSPLASAEEDQPAVVCPYSEGEAGR